MHRFRRGFGQTLLSRFVAFALCFFVALSVAQAHEFDDQTRCDKHSTAAIKNQMERSIAMRNDFRTTMTPNTRPPSELANMPCFSAELQRVSNQFGYAPSMYAADTLGQLNGLMGPVSGIMNNVFKNLTQSFRNAANMNPLTSSIQGVVQSQLGNMLNMAGLGDMPFASALCGLMVDTLLKYLQCEVTAKLPSLSRLTGSLNNLLPKGCAGAAISSSLYAASNKLSLTPMTQTVTVPSGGLFGPGGQLNYTLGQAR